VRALHDAGIEHADLNLRNILLVEERVFGRAPGASAAESAAAEFRALVIDLDRARARAGPLDERRRRANLLRLYRSAAKLSALDGWRLSRADALRFGRAYFGEDRVALRRAARAVAAYAPWLRARRLLWGSP
jgi:hypothetical protein